ncbi:MAG: hypothetical protein RIR07_89 [Bacteroidota bacterium]
MRNFFLSLALAAAIPWGRAQTSVVFAGYVTEEQSMERIPDVMVVNARSEARVATDAFGQFRIEALAHDTLVFSRPGYGYRYVVARQADSARVTMPPRNFMLEEVPVTAYKLTSNLPKDVVLREPQRPSGAAIQVPQAKAPTLANPVDFLYDQFGNRPRQLRELAALVASDQYREKLADSRNRTALFELTGLTESRIEEVLLFCRYNQSAIRTATDYELLVSLIDCYQEFEARRAEQPQRQSAQP